MRKAISALVVAAGIGLIAFAALAAAPAKREPLSAEAFKDTQELVRHVVTGAKPDHAFRLSSEGLARLLGKNVLDRALKKSIAAANQAGSVRAVVLTGVAYEPSSRPGVLLLLEHGALTGVLVPSDVWQSSDEGDDGGGDDGGEEPEFKSCPWNVCMVRGSECSCEADRIDVPEGEPCPDVDSDCCRGYSCEGGGNTTTGTSPPDVDVIFG